jgi:acetyl-CoA C-acetyltransferase
MKDVAVVAYCRTGIAKAGRGALNQTHGIPMAAHVLRNVVQRAGIDAAEVEDVVLGCGLPEGATGHRGKPPTSSAAQLRSATPTACRASAISARRSWSSAGATPIAP